MNSTTPIQQEFLGGKVEISTLGKLCVVVHLMCSNLNAVGIVLLTVWSPLQLPACTYLLGN